MQLGITKHNFQIHIQNSFVVNFTQLEKPSKLKCRSVKQFSSSIVCVAQKSDVVALGNLCVDIRLEQLVLPHVDDTDTRQKLLKDLSQQQHPKPCWEVGGNCNVMIAASRLGLKTVSVGHTGNDVYGNFLIDVLKEEGIETCVPIFREIQLDDRLNQTLLCFVLVDPQSQHAFCSRYDFGPWPLLTSMVEVPQHVQQCISQSRSLFLNGFVFDEMPPEFVQSATEHAQDAGAAVFFDPGPRCSTFLQGKRREALDYILDVADVVLLTAEEASAITGCEDPQKAILKLTDRPGSRIQWAVAKIGPEGAILANKKTGKIIHQQGLKVKVEDTVGCGDSFAAAILKGYVNQQPPAVALALANAVGAATATGRGAGRNVAGPGKVQKLLEYQIQTSEINEKQKYIDALQLLGQGSGLIEKQRDYVQVV